MVQYKKLTRKLQSEDKQTNYLCCCEPVTRKYLEIGLKPSSPNGKYTIKNTEELVG